MGAGDRRDHRKRKVATESVRRGGILILPAKKMKATASPSHGQGFGILKKRKEAMAAQDLWELEHIPGGINAWKDRWLEKKAKMDEEAAAARSVKKRRRVVKQRFSKALIDHLAATPPSSSMDEDLTPVQLAKRSHRYRQLHAMATFIDGKMRDYEQALIDQYNAQGYAEDEREVSDSEEDDTAENVCVSLCERIGDSIQLT